MDFSWIGSYTSELGEYILAYMKAHPEQLMWIVFAMALGESLAIFSLICPASIPLFALGGLVALQGMDPLPLMLAASGGAFLGFAISYWVGLYFQHSVWKIWPISYFTSLPRKAAAAQPYMNTYGLPAVALSYFSGPVRAFVSLFAGITGVSQIRFHLWSGLGALAWGPFIMFPAVVTYYIPEWMQEKISAMF